MFIPIKVGTARVSVSATKGIVPTLYNATKRRYTKEVIAAFVVSECYRKDSYKLDRLVKRASVINACEHEKTTHICISDSDLIGLRNDYYAALKEYALSNPIIIMEYDGRYASDNDIVYLTQTLVNNIVSGKLKLN